MSVLGRDEGYMVKYNLCLKEFPRAKPEGIPEGKGLYLTVYLTVYSLGSVLWKISLAPRKYWTVWFQYSIVKNDIMKNVLYTDSWLLVEENVVTNTMLN